MNLNPPPLSLRLPDRMKLKVCVVGGGPGGCYVALGLAQQGHEVVVLEALAHPAERGTVNRDRSYPVDITARGMAALARVGLGWDPADDDLNAASGSERAAMDATSSPSRSNRTTRGHALRRRLLPFHGHAHWPPPGNTTGKKGGGAGGGGTGADPGRRVKCPGLIGTRDDIVLGMLEHIDEVGGGFGGMGFGGAGAGSVRVFCDVPVASVDLATQTVSLDESAASAASAASFKDALAATSGVRFDLIVACDGKWSKVRGGRDGAGLPMVLRHS